MKLKSGFVLEEVGGTYLAVAVGDRAEEFKVLVKLNATGAFLWRAVAESDLSLEELSSRLRSVYDVSEDVAERDVKAFVKILSDGGLLDE